MKKGNDVITRRDFLRTGSCVAMGSLLALPMLGHASVKEPSSSRVVLVRDKDVLDGNGQPRPGILQAMLDQAVSSLLETTDAAAAWKKLVKPRDTVGIKSNVWRYLPTPTELEHAIQQRLMESGVKREQIAVDDRGVLRNEIFKQCTALINVRPMRTHHWSGLGTLLKNYIMFVSSPWEYHGNACEKLGAIWRLPHVKDKTRLNILVMLTPLFHGTGPHHFSKQHTWRYSGLILSTDTVAADATGARIIQAKRNLFFSEESPISPPPLHIVEADRRFGLGNSRPDRIQLIKLGWEKDILI